MQEINMPLGIKLEEISEIGVNPAAAMAAEVDLDDGWNRWGNANRLIIRLQP